MKSKLMLVMATLLVAGLAGATGLDRSLYLNDDQAGLRNSLFSGELVEHGLIYKPNGDVVGNGGGLHEGIASVYYQTLPSIIRSALTQSLIPFSEDERYVLNEISKVASTPLQKNKFVFVPEEKANGFFQNDQDPDVRLAKTGFSPEFAIYVNLGLLLRFEAGLDTVLLTMIVHELGHQVRVKSHSFLDTLAGKVVAITQLSRHVITKTVKGKQLSVEAISFNHKRSKPVIRVTYGEQVIRGGSQSLSLLQSYCSDRVATSYRLLQGQFAVNSVLRFPQNGELSESVLFNSEVKCGHGGVVYVPSRFTIKIAQGKVTEANFDYLRGGVPNLNLDFDLGKSVIRNVE